MKRLLTFVFLFVLTMLPASSIYAMGVFQGDMGYIPTPATNIGFTIIDTIGVRTYVEHGSIDGKAYISGYSGLILNVIPLDNIASVSFTKTTGAPAQLMDKLDNSPLLAVIHLKDNKVLNIIVDGSLLCYGRTPYGFIRVKLSSLEGIDDIKIFKKQNPRQQ